MSQPTTSALPQNVVPQYNLLQTATPLLPLQPVHPPMAAQETEIPCTTGQTSTPQQLNTVTAMSARVNKGIPPDFFHYSAEYGDDFFLVLEAPLAQHNFYASKDTGQYGLTAEGRSLPHTIQEAISAPQQEQWLAAMHAELDPLAARKPITLSHPRRLSPPCG